MKITIETIPHAEQRYPTVGDWQWLGPDHLIIPVSETGDWRYNAAIAVHELIEALLCRNDGVDEATVSAFDIAYEEDRELDDDSEPGDDPAAPYNRQHCFATAVERMLIAAFGASWDEYGDAVEALL
jgi:hypothetical protein